MLRTMLCSCLALIAVGTFGACSKKPEAAPPPAAPAPAVAQPAPPPAAPAAPPAASAVAESFEGEWSGSSGVDLPVSFSIQGNQVTSFSGSYSGKSGSCSFNGQISSSGPATITGKSFTAQGRSSREELEFTAQGTLTSPTEASGSLVWKGKSELCGVIDLKYQWTAKKAPPPPQEAEDLE